MGRAAIQSADAVPARLLGTSGEVSASRSMASVVAAALVAACLLFSAGTTPLPFLLWAAAFLVIVVQQDVAHLRIPNWLNFPALAVALTLCGVVGGLSGLGTALAGTGTALAVMFLPFVLGWLGAGDVKAGMVLGALWGAQIFLGAFWWMLIAGGVMAIVLIVAQGGLVDLLGRWGRSAWYSLRMAKLVYFRPAADSPARAGLPFGVAMGLGAAGYQLWGAPWL